MRDLNPPVFSPALLVFLWVLAFPAGGAGPAAPKSRLGDTHYTPAGFFDMHLCHWPDLPPHYLTLFSTTRFDELESVEVLAPDGASLGKLDPNRFRVVQKDGAPEKRVFITLIPVPKGAPDGWYRGRITLKSGEQHEARDYVINELMNLPTGMQPPDDSQNLGLAPSFSWSEVTGAKYYKVFVYDLWDDEKTIYQSALITEPRLRLPAGILKPDGYYAWIVHARDVDEHPLLGDFNHGTLSRKLRFTTAR